jgi:Zn finger protein HypA/HybF involved in hydrogenase expression
MGENYTRKTENYTARQNRQQNAAPSQENKKVQFTCWKCHKNFELSADAARPDHVACPFCEMTHGLITHSKDA